MILLDIREEIKSGKSIYELPLVVCYYARVSTDHELQSTSIVNQVDFFKKYVLNCSNWRLVDGYVDEGISGKEVMKRENFLRMIEDGKDHRFDLILTKSVSRFARNTIDSIQYTNLLLDYGVGVMFLNDNINTFYSDSEFRLTLMASIAQDELRKLSDSVRFGLSQSIRRGVILGNNNLFGYMKCKGRLFIVEEEARIIRDIFSLFLMNCYSYTKLGRVIYEKYGKKLDGTAVKRILMNYKYKGYYCGRKSTVIDYKCGKRKYYDCSKWVIYRDFERVPPIVSEKDWDLVQKMIDKRSKRRYSYQVFRYGGKVFCGIHQKMLICKVKKYKKKRYGYYVCPGCVHLKNELIDKMGDFLKILDFTVYQDVSDILIRARLK